MSRHVIDEQEDYLLEAEILSDDALMLHFDTDPETWGLSTYKYFLARWSQILEHLRAKGIVEVFSAVNKDEKLLKFQTMFGMVALIESDDIVLFRRFT